MFQPRYQVSPLLLESIKRITILTHELNKRSLAGVSLMQMQAEAQAVSTYASTSIEGNPLPLTEVKRLLKSRPEVVRQSEREVLNYNQALTELNTRPDTPFTKALLLSIHRGVTQGYFPTTRQDISVKSQ